MQVLSQCSSVPHVMRLLGSSEDADHLYTMVTGSKGVNLIELLAEQHGACQLPEHACVRTLAPVLEAVAGLHDAGIVHRCGLAGCTSWDRAAMNCCMAPLLESIPICGGQVTLTSCVREEERAWIDVPYGLSAL